MSKEVRDRDWYIVGHEEVSKGIRDSNNNLCDLESCQDLFQSNWNLEADCRERVVNILDRVSKE